MLPLFVGRKSLTLALLRWLFVGAKVCISAGIGSSGWPSMLSDAVCAVCVSKGRKVEVVVVVHVVVVKLGVNEKAFAHV